MNSRSATTIVAQATAPTNNIFPGRRFQVDHFSRFNERRIAPFRRYNYFKDRVSFSSSRLRHGGRSNFFKDFFKDRDDFFHQIFFMADIIVMVMVMTYLCF